jgi:hypothetical protein
MELVRDGIPANKRMDNFMSSWVKAFDHVEVLALRDAVLHREDEVECSQPLQTENVH